MKNALAAIALIAFSFSFGLNLTAQSRQRQQVMANTGHADLNTTLNDLDRIAQATQSDIATLGVEKWKSGWKTGFLKDGSHKDQAQQSARSIQRNLSGAMPAMIRDVQTARGSISTTFKLYDDVSLVMESLDSLISASEAAGKKSDAAPLVDDYSALTHVRRSLANYIQQSAANWENRGKLPSVSFSTPSAPASAHHATQASASNSPQIVNEGGVKKIIVDDTVPEKGTPATPAPKKKPVTLTNLE
jgi:hypothetical protein